MDIRMKTVDEMVMWLEDNNYSTQVTGVFEGTK